MTQKQMDLKFPIQSFKQAKESSSLSQEEATVQEPPRAQLKPFSNGDAVLAFDKASDLESQKPYTKHHEDSDSDDDSMPRFSLDSNSPDLCAICIDTMQDADQVRLLTCGHIFHAAECIDQWLLTRQACCPMCKLSFYCPQPEDPLEPEPLEVLESRYLAQIEDEQLIEVRGSNRRKTGVRKLMRRIFGGETPVAVPVNDTAAAASTEIPVPNNLPSNSITTVPSTSASSIPTARR